ncbi:MAG: hypothetical protein SFY81_13630 [Verrucomicrobiota bacterium]|nr:hypothetical protein [Verrucomicrobiota bacterium]
MKIRIFLIAASAIGVMAGDPPKTTKIKPSEPKVTTVPAPVQSTETFVYDQKPVAGRPVLVSPEQAKNVIERFKESYASMGKPKMVIAVNRDLVDQNSGLKLVEKREKTQSNRTEVNSEFKADTNASATAPSIPTASNLTIVGDVRGNQHRTPGKGTTQTKTEKTTGETVYRRTDPPASTLSDKQTVRDVERLFGRPLRMASVQLADQKIATQLLDESGVLNAEGDQARKDRAALSKVADVVLEVLISSRNVTVPEISSDKTYAVPDIQATAIRLSDSKILGQATSSDIIGKDRYAGNIVRNFDVREIAEATALALMEDMMLNAQ